MNLNKLSVISISFLLAACSSHDIKDSIVSDRVKACSAGFSDETQAKLHASLEKASASGDIEGDVRQETKSLIFSETPIEDHVKVYEDYIKCVEANWNVVNPKIDRIYKNEDVSKKSTKFPSYTQKGFSKAKKINPNLKKVI